MNAVKTDGNKHGEKVKTMEEKNENKFSETGERKSEE